MAKRLPDLFALFPAGRQLVDPEPMGTVVEAEPGIDDVDRAESAVELAQRFFIVLAWDMNRSFAPPDLLVLPEPNLFHVEFLMGVIVELLELFVHRFLRAPFSPLFKSYLLRHARACPAHPA